jgi:PD-(D/E)XK nuclease superfamily
MEPLAISARTLGALALGNFCPRCFWINLHTKGKLPYRMPMPGIFISIDRYGKNLVHSYFDAQQKLPPWYPRPGEVVSYVSSQDLHWSRFGVEDAKTGILLRGEPDEIFELQDRSFHIVDYKTAKATPAQDELFPLYGVQLNVYAYICATGKREFSPVSGLSLIYTEPQTGRSPTTNPEVMSSEGFSLQFSAKLERVELDPEGMIPGLLEQARAMYDQPSAPKGKPGCEDCDLFARLVLMTAE